ncbi:hypothetical protein [Micromonospora sp. NPDC023737]|uniref:hypothetical protein n=1 Tax=unclassified Micromonospora TaxID=2617518 RepID=UPI0033F8AF83
MPGVEEGQEEVGLLVVVPGDRPLIVAVPPVQQSRKPSAEEGDRMHVGEEPTHGQCGGQITLDVDVPAEVRQGDLELVEGAQRPVTDLVADDQSEPGRHGTGDPEAVGRAVADDELERHGGAVVEVVLVAPADRVGQGPPHAVMVSRLPCSGTSSLDETPGRGRR